MGFLFIFVLTSECYFNVRYIKNIKSCNSMESKLGLFFNRYNTRIVIERFVLSRLHCD